MISSLRDRWETPDGLLFAAEILERLRSGQPLDGLGGGEVDGRLDLRGFTAPPQRPLRQSDIERWRSGEMTHEALAKKAEPIELEGAVLQGLDLSEAALDNVTIRGSLIEDCVLEGLQGRGLGLARSRVRNTSFRKADLQGAVLGAWRRGRGNEYDHVDFTGADLRGNKFTSWFRDCNFSEARLDKARFIQCGLVRCFFKGPMNNVLFNGNSFSDDGAPNSCQDVDFSNAVFRNVDFRAFDLNAVKLPDNPSLRIIQNYPCVIREAAALLDGRDDEDGRFLKMWFLDQQRGIDAIHPVGLLNRDDFVTYGGENLAGLADSVIDQAIRECGQ